MNGDQIIDWILNISVWGVAKILILFAMLIYLIFAIVVIRQVKAMTKVISEKLNPFLRIISWFHLLLTILIILLSIVIL